MEDRLMKMAERLGKKVEDIRAEVKTIFDEEKRLHPKMSDKNLKNRAMRRLFVRYKRELSSPAQWYQGIVIGDSGVVDIYARRRQRALEMFNKAPEKAIDLGLVDPNGNPIDNRPTLPSGTSNPRYGKPLPEHMFLRSIFVFAKSEELPEPRLYRMVLGMAGNRYKLEPPMYVPLKFRANPARSVIGGVLGLNAATITKFEPTNWDGPSVNDIFESLKDFMVPLNKLEKWHEEHKDDVTRILVSQGEYVMTRETPTTKLLFLWDEGLPETDKTGQPLVGVPTFVSPRIAQYIDFAEESRVWVIGRSGISRRTNLVTGERVETGMSITAFGVYAIPEYKVPLEEVLEVPEAEEGEEEKPVTGEEISLFEEE